MTETVYTTSKRVNVYIYIVLIQGNEKTSMKFGAASKER